MAAVKPDLRKQALANLGKDKHSPSTKPPAGSLEPVRPRDDWTSSLKSEDIVALKKIEGNIFSCIKTTRSEVAKGYIRLGTLLNAARAVFPGDEQFGKWRADKLAEISRSQAYTLMRVATRFAIAPALVEACGFSVLKELAYGTPELTTWVEENIKEGAPPPTARQAAALVKDVSSAPRGAGPMPNGWGGGGNGTKATVAASNKEPPVAWKPPIAKAGEDDKRLFLRRPFLERLSEAEHEFQSERELTLAYLIFGLDPDPSMGHNPEVIDILLNAYAEELSACDDDSINDEKNRKWLPHLAERIIEDGK